MDLNWDSGAGAWQTDNDVTNKVIDVFNFGNGPYFNAEIRIPLSTGNDDSGGDYEPLAADATSNQWADTGSPDEILMTAWGLFLPYPRYFALLHPFKIRLD